MKQSILLSVQALHEAKEANRPLIIDCRFALDDPDAAYKDYLAAHIPGAVYAHLDNDLSSPITAESGRHPLPDTRKFAEFLGRAGWKPGVRLVAYDGGGGAIASRLWWLMKYFGHDDAALLDGGFGAWKKAGYELESGSPVTDNKAPAELLTRPEMVVSASEVLEGLNNQRIVLADARAPERYLGKIEPLDAKAGHIPGAVNYPFNLNLGPEGQFKTAHELRNGLLSLKSDKDPRAMVHMCGSGVTACHNIFAAELAGLTGSRLYVGSWSEWIRDPDRPVEP